MRYTFADCVLDTDRLELLRGRQAIATRPKVFRVLVYLIENRDRVVSKQEILDECWPGRIVGDATLNSCLREIRLAIGDTGAKQDLVKTLHGQGYRFVAPVDVGATDAAADSSAPGNFAAVDDVQAADQPTPEATHRARRRAEPEHKQVSVLACSVDDSDALAASVGAEAMDALMREFLASAKLILSRYGGTVTEWQGDGFTALFGAPVAFEDHARRAVLAAVELRDSMQNSPIGQCAGLSVGLHAGDVVVGSLDDSEQMFTAMGPTTKVAHKIRDVAGDRILASEVLYRLIEINVEGGQRVSKEGLPVLHSIPGLSRLRGGVPRYANRKRSRFVGRDDEMAIMRKRLSLAEDGSGQVVCASGEPGIGKSRLLREFREKLQGSGVRDLRANCLAYSQSTPYYPMLQLVRGACGVTALDPIAVVGRALREKAASAGIDESGVESLLSLLDAPGTGIDSELSMPRSTVTEVFTYVTRLVLNASAGSPLFISIEDLHWLDKTSEEWLSGFVQSIAAVPALLFVTYRPGYQSAWQSHSHVTQLALPRLNDADSTALVDSLREELGDFGEARRQIVNHAQGNPFFLEELTFSLFEGEGGGRGPDSVPTTVQSVLASRIDQLDPADKALLQTAAVIGASVPHELLSAVCGGAEIDAGIRRLERAELLFEDPTAIRRTLHFKHALTRDVAYQSLLSEVRRERHRLIAETYEHESSVITGSQPELVAQHFFEAGCFEKAMAYFKRAGVRATRRWANPEAVLHFERAIEASEKLDASNETRKETLEIYLRLGPPLMSSKSFTSPAVEAAYLKARQLCDQVGTESQLLTVLWGLWLHYGHRGKIDDSRSLARKIVEIAEGVDDDGLKLQAHHAMWTTEIWHGDLATCYEHARAGSRLYDPVKHESHKFLYGGHDPGVCALGTAAIAAWFLGRPQESIELTRAGAALANELDHPYSRIITMHDFMEVEALRGNAEIAGKYGRMAVEACTEQRVPNYLAVGHFFAGYGKAASGEFEEGMARMRVALAQYRKLGAERSLAPYLLFLAELCQNPGHYQEGIQAVEEAEALIGRTGEIRWLPEVHRCKGELVLLQPANNAEAAKELFNLALELARAHGCLAFELRAATSLARLMKSQGRDKEAHSILQPVYVQFKEGFDTRDLREASRLLSL